MMVILNRTISLFGTKTKYILVKPGGLRKSPIVHMRLMHAEEKATAKRFAYTMFNRQGGHSSASGRRDTAIRHICASLRIPENVMVILHEVHPGLPATSLAPRSRPPSRSASVMLTPALIEVVCIVGTGAVAGLVYDLGVSGRMSDIASCVGFGVAVAILFSIAAHARGLYSRPRLHQQGLRLNEMILIWILSFLCLNVVAFVLDVGRAPPAGAVLMFFVAGPAPLATLRWGTQQATAHFRRTGGRSDTQVVVVTQHGRPVSASMAQSIANSGRSICKTISLPVLTGDAGQAEPVRQLTDYVRGHPLDEVLLAIDWADAALIDQITHDLRAVPVPIRLLLEPAVGALLNRPLLDFGEGKAIELRAAPLTRRQLVAKRMLDLIAGLLILLLTLPALLLIAALIRLDSPGPVLFRQRRIGFNGRPFHIYKFRTMTTLDDGAVVQQAARGDARVTRVGRVLRKLSLDELPQLLNVLRGDMSLVGPRPHALAHDMEYRQMIALYAARHNVKPGITGWAQVNGWRGPTPELDLMIRRVEHDLWYVDHWSLWLDIKIMLLTIREAIDTKNAF
jgi:Undecaprenyl-phosphate glucose phosphotransferase